MCASRYHTDAIFIFSTQRALHNSLKKFQNPKKDHTLVPYPGHGTKLKLCYIVIYTFIQHHNDTIIKTHEGRKTQEELRCRKEDAWRLLFKYIYLSLYCKGLKGLFKGLHVRGCWRPNVNFIFWPHCYDRHVVSFLFSWFWGPLHRGFRGSLGRVWLSLPHLVSNSLGVCWQLLGTQTQLS